VVHCDRRLCLRPQAVYTGRTSGRTTLVGTSPASRSTHRKVSESLTVQSVDGPGAIAKAL
jgi:hypothetical protein